MASSFTHQRIDDSTLEFTVVPGKIGSTIGGYALAGVVGFFIAFTGANETGGSVLQLFLGVLAGYGTHRGLLWWRTQRADRLRSPGGTFRVSPDGLVLGSGERIARADIEQLFAATLEPTDLPYCHQIIVGVKDSHPRSLAGGMDETTAQALEHAVKAQLGYDR